MDLIRQSRESLQTSSNQLGSSDPSKLPQGVRTQSLPMHYTQPLQTPVTSVDIQRSLVQMSPSLSGAWQQSPPSLLGPRLGISSGSSCFIQNPLREVRAPWILRPRFKIFSEISRPRITPMHEMLQLSEQFKEMTTEQNTTNESTYLVPGKTHAPLSSGSVPERRIDDVRYRYGKLLPKSLRNFGANDSLRRSRNEGFGCLQLPTNQPGSSGLFELPQGVKDPRSLQSHFTQLLQTPVTSVGIQRPPRQISSPLSDAWQQAASLLLGPGLRISSDSSRTRQNSLQEMQHITENLNNMTTEDDTIS